MQKNALDNIYYICSRQNKLEWLKEQKEDLEKIKFLVGKYIDTIYKFKRGQTPVKWSLMSYIETVEAASQLRISEQGRIMTEEQYVEHAQTPDCYRRLTAQGAREQWQKWEADPVASGLYHTGTKEGKNLMFRVPLGTMVSFESTLPLSTRLELARDKAKKGATIKDTTSTTGRLLYGTTTSVAESST